MSARKRRLQGHLESFAGQRGTGDDVHIGGLRLDGFLLKIGHGKGVDLLGGAAVARILQELDSRNLAVLDGGLNLHQTVININRRSGIGSILETTRGG